MLFHFLVASIAISAVAAAPVRGTKLNEDVHSLAARKDKDLALHEEATEGEVDEMSPQYKFGTYKHIPWYCKQMPMLFGCDEYRRLLLQVPAAYSGSAAPNLSGRGPSGFG